MIQKMETPKGNEIYFKRCGSIEKIVLRRKFISVFILVLLKPGKINFPPLRERIGVRGQFQGNTLTPALSRQGGRGRCLLFLF
jgi:hypothetical protein